jgi:hypothetical protein
MTHTSPISPVTGRYITVEVDGLRYKVFYLENGTGQPLVCQHTAGCHNHQWRGLLEDEDITKNYRVIAYDLPRHGKSDPPENTAWWTEEYRLTADHYVNFIVALVEAMGLENHDLHGFVVRRERRAAAGLPPARPVRRRHPRRGRRLFAGVLPGLVAAPARQRRPGVCQRSLGPDGTAVTGSR